MENFATETMKTVVNIVAVGVFGIFALNRLDGYLELQREENKKLFQEQVIAIEDAIKTHTTNITQFNEEARQLADELKGISVETEKKIAHLSKLKNAPINVLVNEWNGE